MVLYTVLKVGILVEVSIFNRCPDDTVLWQKLLLSQLFSFLLFSFLFMTMYIGMLSVSKTAVFSPQYKELMASAVLYIFLNIHEIFNLVDKDYSDLVSPVVTGLCPCTKCHSISSPCIVDVGVRAEFAADSRPTSLVLHIFYCFVLVFTVIYLYDYCLNTCMIPPHYYQIFVRLPMFMSGREACQWKCFFKSSSIE